jgi:D-alanine-D-alanine ligase-like ATP-grasp enzyme
MKQRLMAEIPRHSFVGRLFKKLAKRAGVTVHLEPRWGFVGQVVGASGKKRYFRTTNFDINTLGASEVARDKDYAQYFMNRMGYRVIEGDAFFSDRWCQAIRSRRNMRMAYRYAQKLGFPVVVKPNSKSQGLGFAKVYTKKEFEKAYRAIARIDDVILVQRFVSGKDYRIVVLDGKIISAYERTPLSVIGDGVSSIRTLLQRKQHAFTRGGRDTRVNVADPRIQLRLKHLRLSLRSVLKKGERICLMDNANLSTGGDSSDVTESMYSYFRKLAVTLTRDMGLRFCGVDIMIDGGIEKKNPYWILEVNSAPGIDHYASSGRKQEKVVEELYLQLLKSMVR